MLGNKYLYYLLFYILFSIYHQLGLIIHFYTATILISILSSYCHSKIGNEPERLSKIAYIVVYSQMHHSNLNVTVNRDA